MSGHARPVVVVVGIVVVLLPVPRNGDVESAQGGEAVHAMPVIASQAD